MPRLFGAVRRCRSDATPLETRCRSGFVAVGALTFVAATSLVTCVVVVGGSVALAATNVDGFGVVGAGLTPFAIHNPIAMYALLALWGGIVMGIYTIGLTMLGERFKAGQLVGANAAYVILYSLGLLMGPAAEGVALDAWNPNGLLVALGGICAVYLGFLVIRRLD